MVLTYACKVFGYAFVCAIFVVDLWCIAYLVGVEMCYLCDGASHGANHNIDNIDANNFNMCM